MTIILGATPRDLLEEGRLDMASRAGGDMEVGEEEEVGRQAEEDVEEDRLNDVRKR